MTLQAKAKQTFNKWIIKRDGYKCVCCGNTNRLCGGHFHHAVLDFDEENINACCDRCNRWLSGNLARYSVYLLNKLGKDAFLELDNRHFRAMGGEKKTPEEYKEIIAKYTIV